MDEFNDNETRPPEPKQLSKTPTWLTLGFVLGAVFVWALPNRDVPPAETPPVRAAPAPRPLARLSTIEAVFTDWARHASWENEITEVALWDVDTKTFADCYEVVRSGDNLYFRSISRLTRPVLDHGVPDASPLQFTETLARRQEWLREKTSESWRAITEAARGGKPEISPPVLPAPSRP